MKIAAHGVVESCFGFFTARTHWIDCIIKNISKFMFIQVAFVLNTSILATDAALLSHGNAVSFPLFANVLRSFFDAAIGQCHRVQCCYASVSAMSLTRASLIFLTEHLRHKQIAHKSRTFKV